MTSLRKDAEKSPFYHIILITLLAVGFVSLPLDYITKLFISDERVARLSAGIFIRIILGTVALIFIFRYNFTYLVKGFNGFKSILLALPALLVSVNNFPIIGMINGDIEIKADTLTIVLYIVYCFSVGYFEELVFSGLVFPLSFIYCENKNYVHRYFISVLISSSFFSLSHLFNIFGGADIGSTMLQVCYTFLIGSMCCISKCITRNVFTAVILHGIYDIGGLLTSEGIGIGYGMQWDKLTIIITVVIGVIVAFYMVYMLKRAEKDSKNERMLNS